MWLPVSTAVVFAVGDFSYGIYDDRPLELFLTTIDYWLPLMWVLGMPLTIAVQLIYRVSGASRRSGILAFAVAAITAPIAVYAYFLSVPLPSFLNTLFGAALAWLGPEEVEDHLETVLPTLCDEDLDELSLTRTTRL